MKNEKSYKIIWGVPAVMVETGEWVPMRYFIDREENETENEIEHINKEPEPLEVDIIRARERGEWPNG